MVLASSLHRVCHCISLPWNSIRLIRPSANNCLTASWCIRNAGEELLKPFWSTLEITECEALLATNDGSDEVALNTSVAEEALIWRAKATSSWGC